MKHSEMPSAIIPFPNQVSSSSGEFVTTRSKIIMKTNSNSDHLLPEAFGFSILDAVRVRDFNTTIDFQVDLQAEGLRETLLCGLVSTDYKRGIAITVDPSTGAIVDALNGAGALGYLTTDPFLGQKPVHCALQIHKFGRNHICTVTIEGESLMYPAFVSESGDEEIFNALVGSDVASGPKISYRSPILTMGDIAKVA